MTLTLDQYLQLSLVVLGFIIWLIRLEGKVRYLDRDLSRLEVKHDALDSQIVRDLVRIRESLAHIEGKLGISR